MAAESMSFLFSYKATLYQVVFDQTSDELDFLKSFNAKSLTELCCQKIVQDSMMTKLARETVPVDLCESLMRAALVLGKDRAVEQLIAGWPWQQLALKNFVVPMFDSVRPLYSEIDLAEHTRCSVKHTTCLAHTFMECLKRRESSKLRYLDLTGYPSGILF